MSEQVNVPDDLKEEYDACGEKTCLICRLIERVVKLEAECERWAEEGRTTIAAWNDLKPKIAKLEAENARLSAPVTDAEWLDMCSGDHVDMTDVQRHELNRFLAARKGAA